MKGLCAGAPSSETDSLVGPAVEVKPGIHRGEKGIQEYCPRGEPSKFYEGTGLIAGHQCGGWCCMFWQWPFSSCVFLACFGAQLTCAPCLHPCLGTRWCMAPHQIAYIHTLYVIQQTLLRGIFSYLCCCARFCVKLQPGILFGTNFLSTPPRFIFDEDKNSPYLLEWDEYLEEKRSTFPPFSGRYRAIDGGGNNATYTFLGQGVRGYAMTEPFTLLSPSALPDPQALVKALFPRTAFKASPWGQNATAAWFANVAIHDFFRSATGKDAIGGVDKPWVNLHSSYLDLQVLYGWNKEMADRIRTFKDGMLKDVAENRFDRAPIPETKAIVMLLMREHNYVCAELKKRYAYEFTTDEALYQQARLVMGGVFINIILRQYGDQMFGEDAPNGAGFAELRQTNYGCYPNIGGERCLKYHQNAGNHLTFNFNLVYRWHTAIPEEWSVKYPPAIKTDDDLKRLFTKMLSQKAGGFGPDNTPTELVDMKVPVAEILSGRKLGCPRLNDFRRRFSTPYTSFEDMAGGDAEVAKKLASFYPSVNDVELSVGVQVERAMQGGWALGNTLGQAILFDAFNSIRQDRFYTTDYTPEIYTDWGYEHTKNTNLVDLLNRHLDLGLSRDMMLARIPDWKPTSWCSMKGWPIANTSFDARGFPITK